ncbi:hypothetical protein [Streptomyces sp. NBC_01615]|uniref:hypothetical protein n=1 Tax=Streptomyces sp. NBC_01615 TaxID=2975898 RepID=UPI00386542CB
MRSIDIADETAGKRWRASGRREIVRKVVHALLGDGMLQQIGLYYPYTHLRDDQWLKAAALYWPKLARVVPNDYPLADSDTVCALADELDLIVPVEPTRTANAVAPMFLEVLERHAPELPGFIRSAPAFRPGVKRI